MFADHKAYTDFQVDLANSLLVDARTKGDAAQKLVSDKPNSEDAKAAEENYRKATGIAINARSKADQAVAEELRLTYKGNTKNKAATEDRAHDIANRYKSDPEAQASVNKALATVTTETPRQRETATAMYTYHRASDKVTELQALKNAGQAVNDADFKAAMEKYGTTRAAAQKAMDNELTEAEQGKADPAARQTAVDEKSKEILDRYEGDEDAGRMAVSARIIRVTQDQAGTDPVDRNNKQMAKLGELLPADADLRIRELVLSDPGIKALQEQYVNNTVTSVTDSYNKAAADYKDKYSDKFKRGHYVPPATAAMNRLTDLTDPNKHPELTPELTAKIINKLMAEQSNGQAGVLQQVIDDVSNAGEHSAELFVVEGAPEGWAGFKVKGMEANRLGYPMPDRQTIITDLCLVTDRAAAGSIPTNTGSGNKPGMKWESEEVRTAVESVGKAVAQNMMYPGENVDYTRMQFNDGFKHAIAGDGSPGVSFTDNVMGVPYELRYSGGVTLALETARQEKAIIDQTEEMGGELPWAASKTKDHIVSDTLGAVSSGLDDLKKNTGDLFDKAHQQMAALEVPYMRYGQVMSPEQQQNAYNNVLDKASVDPKSKGAVQGYSGVPGGYLAGKQMLDQRGYELVRAGEMVTLYSADDLLGKTPGYEKVVASRDGLLNDDRAKTMVMGSDRAAAAMKAKTVHASLAWMQDSGVTMPYAIGPVPINLYLQWSGDFTEHLVEDKYLKAHGGGRVGNMPGVAMATWGAVGVTQLMFTAYLYENVGFDKGQGWRKPLLLGLVGGFGAFKTYQAGTIAAYQLAKGAQKIPLPAGLQSILDEKKTLPKIEEFFKNRSEFTRQAAWKSIGFFGMLHADAAVWDATRVYYSAKDALDGNPNSVFDSRNFFTALINLGNDWTISYLEFKGAYDLFKAKSAAGVPVAELATTETAAAAEKSFASKLGGYGLKALYGPGHLYEFGSKMITKSLIKFGMEKAAAEAIPGVGTLATIAWTATDLWNWIGNQKKTHKLLETIDYDFLTGASHDTESKCFIGVTPDRAKVLADRSFESSSWTEWLHGDSLAVGLLDSYQAMGGDPEKFVEYVNSIPVKDLERMRDGLKNVKDVKGTLPEASQDDYWTLPTDPNDPAQRQFNPNLKYNDKEQRWEDTHLKMFYMGKGNTGKGMWMSIDHPYSGQCTTYSTWDHRKERGMGSDHHPDPLKPGSVAGLRTWLLGNGMPPVPKPTELPQEPVDTSATKPANTYTVKNNDSVWGIAGNDPAIVAKIYELNPWLNERMESDHRPVNERGGQNPNYINPGETIVLPEGYRPKD